MLATKLAVRAKTFGAESEYCFICLPLCRYRQRDAGCASIIPDATGQATPLALADDLLGPRLGMLVGDSGRMRGLVPHLAEQRTVPQKLTQGAARADAALIEHDDLRGV